jgi:hypothetical protein
VSLNEMTNVAFSEVDVNIFFAWQEGILSEL